MQVLILSALFALPPENPMPAIAEKTAEFPAKPPTLDEVRAAYVKALQSSAKRARPVHSEVVPALAEVYVQLKEVEGLSHAERSRMQGVVKTRLEELRDKLIRDVLRNKKLADRHKRTRIAEPRDEKAAMLAAGGPNAQAIKLIDLIQNTIEPESWQANGGQGTISYFARLNALVIRQTGEVHHQLGGVLEQLRP